MRRSGLPGGAWVVVADGEKALFLTNVGDMEDMHLVVRRKEEHENPPTGEWAADRPGRFNDGPTQHRSAVEETDWHKLEKQRFAKDLAEMLYAEAHRNAFKHLVLIASPAVLSQIRDEMHPEVASRVMLDVPKVLTNHPVDEIEKLLTRELTGAT